MKKPYNRILLPNGVRLLLIPMEGVNSVATSVMVGVGSRYETPKISGISHFLEHMVFKGTKKYPTTDDVNVVERIGGIQNAYTDVDITNFHNKVLSTDWQLALEMNKELAIEPRIEQQHVDRERNVILEEMKRYEDEPEIKVDETFHQMMYPKTTLGMRVIGQDASLRAADASTLRTYHDRWYAPERIVVVVAGQIRNHESGIMEKTKEWFGNLPDSKFEIHDSWRKKIHKGEGSEDFERVTDMQNKPRLEVVTKPDAQQAHLMLGFRTFARGSEHRFAWSVFNLLMGISFTSRLFKEIREKRGLCYHVRSSTNSWADVGNWNIYAGVATSKVEEAVGAILAEVTKAADSGVTEEEIAVAKKRFKTYMAFKSEDPEFMNEYYGRQELYHEPILTLNEYIKKIEKVSKEDVNRLVKKYLRQETLNMALVWNKGREEKLQQLLKL